jgi:hypothetical protein
MESHVKIVGILHIVLSCMGVLAAVVVLLAFGGLAGIVALSDHTGDSAATTPILGGVGGILFVIIMAVSVPGLIGGIGLLKMAPWSIDLFNIPFGTALGIYGLWVLTKPETIAVLERRRVAASY